MTPPTLYNFDLDEDCYRVRLVAGCLGVGLTLHTVTMYPGRDHLSDGMLALNPQGRLPVLQDGGLILTQPGAIALHLAGVHAPGHPLLPDDPEVRARMADWMLFAARDLGVAAAARVCAMFDAPGDLAALRAAARRVLCVMEDHMTIQGFQDCGFFAGAEPTLADLMLFPAFALSRDHAVDHDAFPALRLWARRVRALKGFQAMPGIPEYH